MALDVDPTAPRAAGELGVFPRRDVDVCLAVVLDELLDHDGARRHVDAEREGLGREDELERSGREALFHDGLEGRQLAGMVCGDARHQGVAETLVVEGVQIGPAEVCHMPVGDLAEQARLRPVGERDPRVGHLTHRGVADEVDGGQQVRPVEHDRHLGAAGRPSREAGVGRAAVLARPSRPVVLSAPGAAAWTP